MSKRPSYPRRVDNSAPASPGRFGFVAPDAAVPHPARAASPDRRLVLSGSPGDACAGEVNPPRALRRPAADFRPSPDLRCVSIPAPARSGGRDFRALGGSSSFLARMMCRSRETLRAPVAVASTSARVAPVVAILLLASALPGALASDYEGDYALYSGYHAKCSPVMYGVSRPEVHAEHDSYMRDDSIFYARFHVRTPYRFLPERPSDHNGSQPNSTTYNLFAFGGTSNTDGALQRLVGRRRGGPHRL